ncbi:hypothetical protein AVEN_237138-1 [Araneus ventricosus]|uniref:Uncharacterized protein n=1 Tax=Araneus ventricosus TaxID=182803 RepID=A0A4Y2G3E2_ARAVE|nr:hypothetical protein AVEN_237138-1 [Araneus ventricosus]
MNFLQRIQNHLCHESASMSIVVASSEDCPAIRCEKCLNYPVPNVYAFIDEWSKENLCEACELAQLYYELTGDDTIPVPFVLFSIDGIFEKRVHGQPLKRLRAAVCILKALNAPFTQDSPAESPTREMENFLEDYTSALSAARPYEQNLKENERMVLHNVLTHFHQIMNSKELPENKFDFYFQKLVPYVKVCKSDWTPLPTSKPEPTVVGQLLHELHRSQAIRKMFGRYCIPFDIFHVLLGCYACCSDIEAVSNWALDFIVRGCRGHFFWKNYEECGIVQHVQHVLNTEITYKKNTDLYYVKRALQNGEGIESLSENFTKYMQLEKFVREKLLVPSEVVEMVSQNLFPGVLFEKHDMQIAFMIGMGHVANNLDLKTGRVRKGAFAKARRLYNILQKIIGQVESFDAQYTIPWTIDTLKLFMVSNNNINKDLTEIAKVVFQEEEEEE